MLIAHPTRQDAASRTFPVAPLPALPALPLVPESEPLRVPSAWVRETAATFEYAPGTAPWRATGANTDRFEMRAAAPAPGERVNWVRMQAPFETAVAAAAALVLDDTRDAGYGTAHGVFQAAEGGAYFIAPLEWAQQASMPDAYVTLDVDGYGDPVDAPSAVVAGSSDLKAIVGLANWVDLRS